MRYYCSGKMDALFLQPMSLCFHMSLSFSKNVSLFCCSKILLKFLS